MTTEVVVTQTVEVTKTETKAVEVSSPGIQGPGVPAGGATGQVLRKKSNADFDTEWFSGGGGGATTWGSITGTLSNQTDLQTALNGKQNTLGFTPENVANKSSDTSLGTSNALYPTQNAVKVYVDTGLSGKQDSLGFTPEDVANKSTSVIADQASNTKFPSVKAVYDWAVATFQGILGYTPEDVGNKSNNTGLGTSTVLYPTQNAVKTYVDTGLAGKRDKSSRSRFVMIETDFTSIQTGNIDGVAYAAISSGAITATVAEGANHPGIVMFRDAAAVNSGYRIMSEISAILLAGGEKFVVVFKTRDARTTSTVRMGFFDSNSVTEPTDCACFIMNGNGTNVDIRGRTRANNTATETSVQTLALNTWYTGEIEVNANATSCQFTVYNENGTTLFTQSLGNLPTAAGRETGFGLIGFESTTDAANDLVGFDYMRVEINRTLVR
jgi:hypothetical protein